MSKFEIGAKSVSQALRRRSLSLAALTIRPRQPALTCLTFGCFTSLK